MFFAGGRSWHLFGDISIKVASSLANDGELVKPMEEHFDLDSESEILLLDLCEMGFVYFAK